MKVFTIEKYLTTQKEIEKGLMGLHDFPSNGCAVFQFSSPRKLHFWGKNTFIPLCVLFIDENNKIESIKNIYPMDTTPVSSEGACTTAIEIKFNSAKGLEPGMSVDYRSGMVFIGA